MCCLAHGELAWIFHEPHTGLDAGLGSILDAVSEDTEKYSPLQYFYLILETFKGIFK